MPDLSEASISINQKLTFMSIKKNDIIKAILRNSSTTSRITWWQKNNKEKLKEDIKKDTKKGIWWKITFNGKQQLMEVLKCGAVEFVWCRGHCIYNSGALPSERYCSTLEHYLLKGTAPLWSTTFRKVLLHSGALPSERYCSRVEHYLSEGSAPTVSLSIPHNSDQCFRKFHWKKYKWKRRKCLVLLISLKIYPIFIP